MHWNREEKTERKRQRERKETNKKRETHKNCMLIFFLIKLFEKKCKWKIIEDFHSFRSFGFRYKKNRYTKVVIARGNFKVFKK